MNDLYGAPPIDLGLIDISPREMMFWLYCPIKLRGNPRVSIPENLQQFTPIISAVFKDIRTMRRDIEWLDKYVYITAKTLFVTADNPGNRPGWHSDGFMTDDLNYIWSDSNGTLFWEPERRVSFVQDHVSSLDEMEAAARVGPHATYPDKHLLGLDESVIHRVADVKTPRVRTFVKVSVSRERYDLVGNSINHDLARDWQYAERKLERNAPASAEAVTKGASHD